MDTQPWDYWTDGGRQAKGRANEIVAELERAMARNPDHPGAIHLYIHAVEASDRPERAEAPADRLAALMPGAGHVVHMPSHIYYRVGRYRDALAANKAAVAVDEVYIDTHRPSGPYPLAYYPHNLHFLLAAAHAAGDGATALEAAGKLRQVISPELASAIPMVQPDMAAPYWANAVFGRPEAVLALTVPDDAPTFVKAMWRYARGITFVSQGRADNAESEITAIRALEGADDLAKAAGAGIPGPAVLGIAREVLGGRIAQANRDLPAALGAALLAAGRPAEA
jgi:tetratricopeptide (TPR) repeat protein